MACAISTRISRICALLPFLAFTISVSAQDAEESNLSEWDQLLLETEETLEWSEDPLADIEFGPPRNLVWTVSARAGGGYSTNFLRRVDPISSRFLKLEGDIFANLSLDQSQLTGLVFFEFSAYDRESEADQEAIVFLHTEWEREKGSLAYGLNLNAFYGDQIYDASLNIEASPEGERLRQFRPKTSAFIDWYLTGKDVLRLEVSVSRALFEEARDDYWQPGLNGQWTRIWTTSWKTTTTVGVYGEFYDEEIAREPDGWPVEPEEKLEITGLHLEEKIAWQPRQWPDFQALLRFGMLSEEEKEGSYESFLRYWTALSAQWDFDFLRLRVHGRRQEVRYRDRQVSYLDERTTRQTYNTLSIEAKKPLPWNTALILSVEWNDFDSRRIHEQFFERRYEALLEWTY